MDMKMKKLSIAALAGASALAIGNSAHAALMTSVVVTPASQAGGYNNDTYELVSFYLTGLSGVDTKAGTLGSGGALIGLSVDIKDATTPNGLFVPGAATGATYGSWTNYITNSGEGAALAIGSNTTDSSFVNLDTALTPAYDGSGSATTSGSGAKTKVTAISGNATNFNASWGAVTGAGIVPGSVGGSANNLIAQVYALPGDVVTLTGLYTTYGTNGGAIALTSGTVATGPTTQPIISLIAGTTPGSSYGSPDGTLSLTGKGSGSYNVATAQGFTNSSKGTIAVTGFNPATDTEIYALKLTSNGTAISGTQISTVIADINGGGGNVAPVGVVASAVTGIYTTLFPGYEVLLTESPGVSSSSEFEFDFSSTGDADSAVPGLVVTGVAAVPEPATAAGVVMGAAGLLLGRRKNRLTVA